MRLRPAGDRGVLVELADADARRLVDARLRADPPAALVDLVPGATTVLARFTSAEALLAALPALRLLDADGVRPDREQTATDSAVLVVPTNYDGDDLATLAAALGWSESALVEWHTGQTWSVEFGGFLPGFGYLVGDGSPLEVPRLTSPRTRVPAGSVGLAGAFSAVYPQASPGGWQLIGRTDLAVWDVLRDPPALLTPGRRVRFERSDAEPARRAGRSSTRQHTTKLAGRALTVLAPGPLALVEDLGRPGHGALGVPTGGAADRSAHRLANRLVGNAEGAATIECLLGGLSIRADHDLVVSLSGAPAAARIDGRPVAHATVLSLPAGSGLDLGVPGQGLRTYLAVRGGIEAGQRLFGSFSSDPTTGLGPLPLRPGDRLAIGAEPAGSTAISDLAASSHRWGDVTVRVVLGPADDWFTGEGVRRLTSTPWRVSPHSDRVGIRLSSPNSVRIERAKPGERASEGVVRGAIQVPASGEPLVFLADHPTTGGYPVIACVLDADTDALAQCRPGDVVRFRAVPATHR